MEPAGAGTLLERFQTLLGSNFQPASPPQRVHAIINPAAGQDQPILKTLNAAMQAIGADWDVFITKQAGDGRRLAQEAVQAGVDMVVVHGGDGTVMEVASGLIGSAIPLAIIPGGTANVMSLDLGIPTDMVSACALAINPAASRRRVDMGQVGEHYFMLRASMGFEAAMVAGADRELKDRLGVLAYGLAALQALANPPIARYRLSFNGQTVETEGLTCIIANSGLMGISGVYLTPQINVSDGLLDVVVVTETSLPALVALAASVVGGSENPPALQHWQVQEVTVVADPVQIVQVDGEILGESPVTARVIPQAVEVIVPPADR